MRTPCLGILVLLLVLLALLGFLPSSTTAPYLPETLRNNDKLLHYISFAFLALILHFALNFESIQKTVGVAAAGLGVLAVASEILQSLAGIWSGRSFDAADILANVWGGVTGLALAVLLDIPWRALTKRRRKAHSWRASGVDGEDTIPLNSIV
ncbi:hypothetical protein DFJ77DRAFT_56297 [Powellomyces hirtus]|nr:hypothetical protein DFJ77DRAFT_56297 [Powellomyces hirtus]